MTQIGKGVIALSAVSALGGVGAYAGGLFDKSKPAIKVANETITVIPTTKDRLEKEGFELLSSNSNSNDWRAVLIGYRKAKTKTFTGKIDATREQPSLISECENQLKLNTEKSYELARQWCVKEKSVSEILGKGYTILDTTQDKENEREAWSTKVNELKASEKEEFKALKELMKDENTNPKTLREECGKLKPTTIKTTDETFGDVFEKTRAFCAVKK